MKQKNKKAKKETYIAPKIEVVEIVMEQNIFAGSTTDIPGMPGQAW